jgi:hypothetical protein
LRGNLRELSLPDIFQLITFSGKTGVLRIRRGDGAEGGVWFRDGDVFFAQSNWRSEPLGERLVAAQRITPMALKNALALRAKEPEGGKRLGEILVEGGYVTDKVLEAFVQEQMQDTIFDLMRWDEGDFEFETLPDGPDEDIGLAVSIENVIMEGSRRLEEWVRIKKKIPSMEIVFKMATAPGEGTFEISLKPAEWNLLLLVDGSRTVAELATVTNRTDFEVARIIYGLFSAGLLEFASDDEVVVLRAEREKREAEAAEQAKLEAARKPKEKAKEKPKKAAEKPAEKAAAATRPAQQPQVPEDAKAAKAPRATPPEVEAVEESGPVEVPEFLGAAGGQEATAEDMAALEAAMGAVLGQAQEAPSAPKPVASESTSSYTPGEEPAFIAASGGGEAVASAEELFADIVEMAPAPVEAAPEELASPQVAPEVPASVDETPQRGEDLGVEEVTLDVGEAAVLEEVGVEEAVAQAPETTVDLAEDVADTTIAAAVEDAVAPEAAPEFEIVSEAEFAPPTEIVPPEDVASTPVEPPTEDAELGEAVVPPEADTFVEVSPPEETAVPDVKTVAGQWAISDLEPSVVEATFEQSATEAPEGSAGFEVADFEAVLEAPAEIAQPTTEGGGEPDALAPELQSVAASLDEMPESQASAPPMEPGTFVIVPAASEGIVTTPEGEEVAEVEVEPLSSVVPEVVSADAPAQAQPPGESASAVPGLVDYEQDLMSLGMAGLPSGLEGEATAQTPSAETISEVEPPAIEVELSDEELGLEPIVEPMGISVSDAAGEEGHDFSELLESLDIGAEESEPVAGAKAAGSAADLLLEEPGEVTAGVISTDVFLDDLDQDLGYSGELTDELSALTGAQRPVRPAASVRQIPAEGESTIRRDTRVNRETLMKIIDGIKDL